MQNGSRVTALCLPVHGSVPHLCIYLPAKKHSPLAYTSQPINARLS
jgi:hypothetical protein